MRPSAGNNPVYLALVSPCSTCKNQLAAPQPGLPACPRRAIEAKMKQASDAGGDTAAISHLALYGTEGTDQAGDGSYRNPVYGDTEHAILVWVAALMDNGGTLDSQGNVVNPNLLDPGFDTKYMHCRPLPVIPSDSEAQYFAQGAFMEGDHIEVRQSAQQQLDVSGSNQAVLIDGFAQKVNFVFFHPRQPVTKDLCPAGS